MAGDAKEAHSRLRELLPQLTREALLLDRIIYKNRNQHRRCLYFRRLTQVARDVRLLLHSANLSDALHSTQTSENASPAAADSNSQPSASIRFRATDDDDAGGPWDELIGSMWRLLGIARLLQQMQHPILKASSQIAALLGQSFFMPFALTVLAILARLRILLLQALHDVILIYNLLSHGCNCRMLPLEAEASGSARLNSKKRVISVQGFRVEDKLPFWLVCCSKDTRLFLHESGSAELPEFSGWEAFPSLQWFNDIATKGDLFGELWREKQTENKKPQKFQSLKIEENFVLASLAGAVSEKTPGASIAKEDNLATDMVGHKRKFRGSFTSLEAAKETKLDEQLQLDRAEKEISRKKKELLEFLEQNSLQGIPASLQVAGKSSPLATDNQGSKRKVAYISIGSHSVHRLISKEGEGSTVGNSGAVHSSELATMPVMESDKIVNSAGSQVKQRTDNLFEMLIGDRIFDSLF